MAPTLPDPINIADRPIADAQPGYAMGNTRVPVFGQPQSPQNAIAGIESGGRYDALGPVIPKTGDRAYGKYQVMGANVPVWTREILGREMTPKEFLNNPAAQDAVFNTKFGEYQQKYGNRAASAWFAGEQGMNNPNARDVLGTTVAGYQAKYDSAMPTEMSARRQQSRRTNPRARQRRLMRATASRLASAALSRTHTLDRSAPCWVPLAAR